MPPPSVESPEFLKGSLCGQPVDGAQNILIMGDSIAADAYAWIHMAYPEYNIIQRTGNGCSILRLLENSTNPKQCIAILNSALEIAMSPTAKIDAVVVAGFWNSDIVTPSNFARQAPGALIDKLLARGRKVVLMGPPVGFTAFAQELVERCPGSSADGPTPAQLEQCAREHLDFREANTAIRQYAQQKGIAYVDLHQLLCNELECPLLDEEGQLMFVDSVHRSVYGDAFVARRFREHHVFEGIFGAR